MIIPVITALFRNFIVNIINCRIAEQNKQKYSDDFFVLLYMTEAIHTSISIRIWKRFAIKNNTFHCGWKLSWMY